MTLMAGAGGAAAFGTIAGLANLGVNLGLDRGDISTADIINMAFDSGALAMLLSRAKTSQLLAEPFWGFGDEQAGPWAGDKNYVFKVAWILVWTLTIIEIMEQLNGFGSPATRDTLADHNSNFGAADQTLVSAHPDTNQWSGDAESGYAGQNSAQQTRASDMATADQALAEILERQADQVERVRTGLAATKLGVLAAIPYALYLVAVPGSGQAASDAFQWKVARVALVAAGVLVGFLIGEGLSNAKDVQHKVIDKYNGVAGDAAKVDLTKQLSEIQVPLAAPSVVPDVSGLESSGPPDVSGTVVEGAAADQRARRGVAGDEETAGEDTKPAPQTPAQSAPAMPTLAQLIAVSGQTTKLFEPGAQRTTPVKAGAPSQQAAAEEAVPADDDEGAGAAPGTQHAEGAPIEVAGVGAQPQKPTPFR